MCARCKEDELDEALLGFGTDNVELPCVWFSSGAPKKILPFARPTSYLRWVPDSRVRSIPTVCMHA